MNASNDFCTDSFTDEYCYLYTVDSGSFGYYNKTNEAQITAACESGNTIYCFRYLFSLTCTFNPFIIIVVLVGSYIIFRYNTSKTMWKTVSQYQLYTQYLRLYTTTQCNNYSIGNGSLLLWSKLHGSIQQILRLWWFLSLPKKRYILWRGF